MQIHLIVVGKLKEKYWREAQDEYTKRLSRFCELKIVEVAEERLPDNASESEIATGMQKEGERIRAALPKQSVVITLEIEGQMLTSPSLAEKFQAWMTTGQSGFTLVMGGSNGLSLEVSRMAEYKLSLSRMTYPHQMARIVLLEQLYRVMKINHGETYHK